MAIPNIKELADSYGTAILLKAAIMRHTGCSELDADDHYWKYWLEFDRLMELDEE